jgi:putative ABC transport system ATP-binding protein
MLLRASGRGKPTLFSIIGGLDTASRGELLYYDQDLCKFTDRELTNYRRTHVGFVLQFTNLVFILTARENVASVADIAPYSMASFDALARVVAKRLHI